MFLRQGILERKKSWKKHFVGKEVMASQTVGNSLLNFRAGPKWWRRSNRTTDNGHRH